VQEQHLGAAAGRQAQEQASLLHVDEDAASLPGLEARGQ
jgi:hypothetical protein